MIVMCGMVVSLCVNVAGTRHMYFFWRRSTSPSKEVATALCLTVCVLGIAWEMGDYDNQLHLEDDLNHLRRP